MTKRKIEDSTVKSSVLNGNGILRCYNMFPTQFKNIDAMTDYLPSLKTMGFNAVWINPIQTAGKVAGLMKRDKSNGVRTLNEVSQSLYAMTDGDMISSYYSTAPSDVSSQDKKLIDQAALMRFTTAAKENNLVPMFDLVLNHVASDSELRVKHPEWFHKEPHKDFQDAIAFDYSDPKIRDEIIEQFWRPYLQKYMVDYGFDGVRVDAVGYLDKELRKRIYEIIYEIARDNKKPKPVILDELLFGGDKNQQDVVNDLLLPESGPTHITRGTYYAHRDGYGGLPEWCKTEEGIKAQVVFLKQDGTVREGAKGGCIAFSGNHDHNSLAMTVLEEMAMKRLELNFDLYQAYNRFKEGDEAVAAVFLFSFIKDIQNEIINNNKDTIQDAETKMREKIAMCSLTSSGGWYALSGDEYGDLLAKPVFRRANAPNQTYYAQQTYKLFSPHDPNYMKTMSVLTQMAKENIKKEKPGIAFNQLKHSESAQNRLLTAYIENLKNQINCGDTMVCELFQQKMRAEHIEVKFTNDDYIDSSRTPENHWGGKHDMSHFMTEINSILDALPTSHIGFWSELIHIPNQPDLLIVVRKNGIGLDSETDIAIVNLKPENPVTLTREDIHEIACNFQKRVIPERGNDGHNNWTQDNPMFSAAYHCVMTCIPKQRIHTGDAISLKLPTPEPESTNPHRIFTTPKVSVERMLQASMDDTLGIETPSETEEEKKKENSRQISIKTQ